MNNTPERWVVIKLTSQEHGVQRRVLAGWYGGYLGSDSWKCSSPIVSEDEHDDRIVFHSASGNTYTCYKGVYGMSGYMNSVYSSWERDQDDTVTIEIDNNPTYYNDGLIVDNSTQQER